VPVEPLALGTGAATIAGMDDELFAELTATLGSAAVLGGLIDREQWSGDASIYRLVPRVVVLPRSASEVQTVLRIAARHAAPVCFRAGGTSLSGQAVSDGILVVVSRHLRAIRVLDHGERVACAPGAVGAWVNAALAPHDRRIGPDPASMQAAEIGGIVANNASGMCCGVADNSYHTVSGLDLILADGYRIDTAAADADALIAAERPQLAQGLCALRDEVLGDAALRRRISTAFATKNTVGYSINAFLDEQSPARILQRLVVGSEGTLAFIAEATFRTLPLPRHRATAWLMFPSVEAACLLVGPLSGLGAAAIELLDAVALSRVERALPHDLPGGEPAALLVEFQETSAAALAVRVAAAAPLLRESDLCAPAAFTSDPALQARYWKVRKGLFPSVGAIRARGTAVVIEDVTFPVAGLADGVRRLRACFATHGYGDAVIFGHARDGNLHFTLTPDFGLPGEVERYDRFMRDLVDCVLGAGGHLKAEHGTGRNMAPFVVRQWGEDAVRLMRRIKALLDPQGLLNPGVLLSDDPQAHLRHLKTLPAVDALVDQCIECGFCEPVCPSRDLTYSPRQRIAALRAIARGGEAGAAVRAGWQERGLDSCAADGMCATACPVHIDTGALVRAERALGRGALARWCAGLAERQLGMVTLATRLALGAARALRLARLPGTRIRLPAPASRLPTHWPAAEDGAPTVVYLPSCLGRTFGDDDLPGLFARLCRAAGIGVVLPAGAAGLCCGQPFASKGFPAQAERAAGRSTAALLAAAAGQAAMLVTDTSSCAAQLEGVAALPGSDRAAWAQLSHRDPASFAATILIPRLRARGRLRPAALDLLLHPTCAEHQHGWAPALALAVQAASSGSLQLPEAAGCCGMAGDKGWSLPALTAHATQREAEQARASGASCGVTTSASCGAALSEATGMPYRHLFALLAEALT
jgi:D-lactate dehydrogenase